MNKSPAPAGGTQPGLKSFFILLAVLLIALGALFSRSFQANQVLYSNDGPLGLISAKAVATTPDSFSGVWYDLNWLGNEGVAPAPTFTALMALILKPVGYAKFSVPLALFVIGVSAWLFFRQLRLAPLACVLGGIAAALNSDFFSTACWGVVGDACCAAACYLALAAITKVSNRSARWPWLRVILAGVAVGMAVMEGYDVGALFSLFVAAYVLYQALFLDEGDGAIGKKLGRGMLRVGLVAVLAAFTAVHVLTSLVGTQITGVVGMEQTPEAIKARWNEATRWSLPKAEILQVGIPGVFGYRQLWHMYEDEQPREDQYWGTIGAPPNMDEIRALLNHPNPQARAYAANILGDYGNWRLSGTGLYAGVLVVVVALWAALQAFRRLGSPYSIRQRRAIWFWGGALVVAMLLGFGRYAPFYQIFYSLPYAATIRNPTKFMHVFSWIIVIVFAYGVHGLTVAYLQNPATRVQGLWAQFKSWRGKASPFERRWVAASFCAVGAAIIGWRLYAASGSDLKSYLASVAVNPDDAPAVAGFSFQAAGWFALFLLLTVGLLAAIFSGQFAGPRAKWAGVLLGLLLLVDLGRADKPWMVYFDTSFKYAGDPAVNFLAEKPHEHRVSFLPLPPTSQQWRILQTVYGTPWEQGLFWYNNVQCTEVAQDPRTGTDKIAFLSAVGPTNAPGYLRYWELTGTRYLFGPGGGGVVEGLNAQFDPEGKHFRFATGPDGKPLTFDLALKRPRLGAASSGFVAEPRDLNRFALTEYSGTPPKPNVISNYIAAAVDFITVPKPEGQLALIEFTGALPRAGLYANWRVITNDQETLQTLPSRSFDPHQTVLVGDAIAAPDPANAGKSAGDVKITEYEPKRIKLEANAAVPSVLLLCDRYNPRWEVSVDGQPAQLLKCNFVCRGVQVPTGKHSIEFRYHPPSPRCISVSPACLSAWFCAACSRSRVTRKNPFPPLRLPPRPPPFHPRASRRNDRLGPVIISF